VETPSQFEVPWEVGILIDIILTLWKLEVSLKFHGGGDFDIVLTCLNLVDNPSHFEVPRAWEF
jgi:hypothetical protein